MTTEPHDAASKLAWRDRRIAELEAECDELRRRLVEDIEKVFGEPDFFMPLSCDCTNPACERFGDRIKAFRKLIKELKQGDV